METFDLIGKITAIQEELGAIEKGRTNPFHGSSYFDINDILRKLRPLIKKHNLSVQQPLTHILGKSAIGLRITDLDSGEMTCDATPLAELTDPQKFGSYITYMRRYQLVCYFLIEGEIDDDANTASGLTAPKTGKASTVNDPKNAKMCPSCDKVHEGKYAKCIECWKADQSKIKSQKEELIGNVGGDPEFYKY